VTFTDPITLPADHYFFVPQVSLTNGGQFYWLSASRPVSGAGTTPFPPGVTDLQAWTRDAMLDPDWLRVGMDIVGGTTPPAFNTAFSLSGDVVPEPASVIGVLTGLGLLGAVRRFAVAPGNLDSVSARDRAPGWARSFFLVNRGLPSVSFFCHTVRHESPRTVSPALGGSRLCSSTIRPSLHQRNLLDHLPQGNAPVGVLRPGKIRWF
jgi:hypothetical protein